MHVRISCKAGTLQLDAGIGVPVPAIEVHDLLAELMLINARFVGCHDLIHCTAESEHHLSCPAGICILRSISYTSIHPDRILLGAIGRGVESDFLPVGVIGCVDSNLASFFAQDTPRNWFLPLAHHRIEALAIEWRFLVVHERACHRASKLLAEYQQLQLLRGLFYRVDLSAAPVEPIWRYAPLEQFLLLTLGVFRVLANVG